ncbi:hypothetical protein C8R44DRAFT_725100 [Mycena epipterygia]|nr:hypothetical protein C8R44DRAFT_725100 [Mycena epipterygia]
MDSFYQGFKANGEELSLQWVLWSKRLFLEKNVEGTVAREVCSGKGPARRTKSKTGLELEFRAACPLSRKLEFGGADLDGLACEVAWFVLGCTSNPHFLIASTVEAEMPGLGLAHHPQARKSRLTPGRDKPFGQAENVTLRFEGDGQAQGQMGGA